MSTNIQSLKVKTLQLALPLRFDFQQWLDQQEKEAGVLWCKGSKDYVQANLAEGTWELPLSGENACLSGVIQGDTLITTKIECTYTGSSHLFHDVIIPLFKQFQGVLEALIVWEDGSVYRTTVLDGKLAEEEVEW